MSALSEVELKVRALDGCVAFAGMDDESPVSTDNGDPDDSLRKEFRLVQLDRPHALPRARSGNSAAPNRSNLPRVVATATRLVSMSMTRCGRSSVAPSFTLTTALPALRSVGERTRPRISANKAVGGRGVRERAAANRRGNSGRDRRSRLLTYQVDVIGSPMPALAADELNFSFNSFSSGSGVK